MKLAPRFEKNMQINYAILLIAILVLINFNPSDQFLKKIEAIKGFKALGFNSNFMQLSTLSNNKDFDIEAADILESRETEMKGIDMWNRIQNNYLKWIKELKMADVIIIIDENSKKEFFKAKIDEKEFVLWDETIPDVIAFSVKNSPMNLENLKATIKYFFKYEYYSQLTCLITHQNNPPITIDHFVNISVKDLTGLFEHLFMMNPDKLDLFFYSSSPNYVNAIVSFLCCDKCNPKKFNEIVEKIMSDSEENLSDALTLYYMHLSVSSYKNHEYILQRNEKFVNFCRKKYTEANKYLDNDSLNFTELGDNDN